MSPPVETHLWTSDSAIAATGGRCLADWRADGVTIDSRDVNSGDLFIAIRGPKFDGHDFTADALAAGAACAVVDHRPDAVDPDAPLLEVADTMVALEDLGRAARDRSKAKVIAVTGSVGKTSVKEMLARIYRAAGPAHWNVKSFNNHWGVPLTLARMPENTERAVFEIGMSTPGEIARVELAGKGSVDRAIELASKHFDTGMVFINTFGLADPSMPFGGVKNSGYGREHGGFGVKEFANAKAIFVGAE